MTTSMKCDARIQPFLDMNILDCDLEVHPHTEHISNIKDAAYPGSITKVHWFEDDRRNFRGDWQNCTKGKCDLPNKHRGECHDPAY